MRVRNEICATEGDGWKIDIADWAKICVNVDSCRVGFVAQKKRPHKHTGTNETKYWNDDPKSTHRAISPWIGGVLQSWKEVLREKHFRNTFDVPNHELNSMMQIGPM